MALLPQSILRDADGSDYPRHRESLPESSFEHGRYILRFARDRGQLERILRLRYQVFNLELGEGLDESKSTGLDRDRFDAGCHHLMVVDRTSGDIVGTYRLQTSAMATSHCGFYSDGEFDLGAMPEEMRARSVELGRACISLSHRNRQVLFLLWRGLAAYVVHNQARYFFGCSSLTSQDPRDGQAMLELLTARGDAHPSLVVPPRQGFECIVEPGCKTLPEVEIPSLFRTYLRYGAKVCGPPAMDREFKTIDFFMLFDLSALDARTYRLFFE